MIYKSKEKGSHDTIISITVEEDFSNFKNYLPKYNEYDEEHLYLQFQMFSGDEFHIMSKEVIVETQDNVV